MSEANQTDSGGLWGRETHMPTLTPLTTDRQATAASDAAAAARSGRVAQQQTRRVARRDQAPGEGTRRDEERRAEQEREEQRREEQRREQERNRELAHVRVQWAETTRYEADLYVDPLASEDVIVERLGALPAGQRRVLTAVESDYRLVSVVDVDGDGHIDAYEMSASAVQVDDWGVIADDIDERIAESPSWPRLNAALQTAARSGWPVEAELPVLAAESPLPDHDPAGELYYRLLNRGTAEVAGDSGATAAPPPRPDEPPSYASDAPRATSFGI